jgi:N-methylhydantoinase A/oxoprolinase/acetone carboxylase beta subunit
VWRRDRLPVGSTLSGPMIVIDESSTTWVASGWWLVADELRNLKLSKLHCVSFA